MDVAWVRVQSPLSACLLDYPASLPQDFVAASLVQAGISLNVVSIDEAINLARAEQHVFLLSAVTSAWPTAVEAAKRLRIASNGSVLIAGGYHVSALPTDAGTELFDYVVAGEGEEALREIVVQGRTPGDIAIPSPQRPRVISAPRIANLDEIPLPARSLLKLNDTGFAV